MENSIRISGIQMEPPKIDLDYLNNIKQKLLLFDTIGINNIHKLQNTFQNNKIVSNEISKLIEKEFVFDFVWDMVFEKIEFQGKKMDHQRLESIIPFEFFLENRELSKELRELMSLAKKAESNSHLEKELNARIFTIYWNASKHKLKNEEFIPVLSMSYLPQYNKPKSNVYKVIFNNVPIPHPETPLDHIIEFRQNDDNKGRLLQFRTLINKLSKSTNEIEIQQEIDDLMHRYKTSMELHKIKPAMGWLEIAGLFIVDPRLAASNLISKLISLKEKQLNLASAELSLPGREISYLYKANQTFAPYKP